jgi:hypothetical protein
MTYYSKLKTSILTFLFGAFLFLSFDCLAVPLACTKVNGAIVPTLNVPDNNFDCFTAPTDQRVFFYKIAFCKATTLAVPANAVTPNVINLDRSTCSILWQNPAGAEVKVTAGSMNTFPGTISMPPVGTYNSVYIELDPTFAYAWSGTIAPTVEQIAANHASARTFGTDGQTLTNGLTCFTNGGRKMNNQRVGQGFFDNITCNNGPAAPVPSIINNNNIGMIVVNNNPVSITNAVDISPNQGSQKFSAALINQTTGAVIAAPAQDTPVNSPNPRSPVPGTTVIGAWMAKTINITPTTTSFAAKMSNTQGINIQMGQQGNAPATIWNGDIHGAVNGSFDFDLTVQ